MLEVALRETANCDGAGGGLARFKTMELLASRDCKSRPRSSFSTLTLYTILYIRPCKHVFDMFLTENISVARRKVVSGPLSTAQLLCHGSSGCVCVYVCELHGNPALLWL